MGSPSVIACALMLAICLPAICQGQQYWGGYGWRTVQQASVSAVCERAYPVDEATTVRTTCRYPCKGWPVRYGFEEDGTSCQLSWWRQGFCFRGRCQKGNLVPSVPRDEDNNVEGRPKPARLLVCINRRQRVKFPAVVRSCQFVCKQRRNAFLANEDNGTPCLAWGGNVGYCDQGVCKAVEATAAPTTAQETSTVGSTTPQVPAASSATAGAGGVTDAATEKDVAVSLTDAATTAATTQAPVPAVPVVRPPGRPGFVGVKCNRAYPARVSDGRVAKCRFLCGGTPFLGIGFEEDGTPCWIKKTLEGVCFDGKCKPVPPTTEAATTQEESSTAAVSTAQTDAAATKGAGDESSTQSATDTEEAQTLSTSTTSGVQEGDDTNTNQGATVEGDESTTAKSQSITSEQQAGPEEQATTTNSSPSEDEEANTEENVSEEARTTTTVESGTTENNGNSVVEVTTAPQQKTTAESVPEDTAVETETDITGSRQEGTPSVDEATTQIDVIGDGEQVSTAAVPNTGDDEEEGSGNTDELTTSDVSPQEATTSRSGVEEVVAVVSETDAVIVDASTQSPTEGTAEDDAKFGTDEPQTSQASVTTTGLDAGTDAAAQDQEESFFTEAVQDAQNTASAVTDDLQEVTQTENADRGVVEDVTVSSQENPSTLPAQEEAGDHTVTTPETDHTPITTTSSDVVSTVEKEVTEEDSLATTEQALEATTASVESETVKVITTVTRKEIVRPVGSDDLSEATLVDSTRSTSVETLPVSELNDTVKPTGEESDVSVSGDNPDVAVDENTVQSQDRSSDGASENEPEAGALTSSTVEAAEAELVVTEQPEAKAVTVSDENAERTTVADESATVKVVTTITEKEITRPIDDEANQSEGTSVDTTHTTSVETFPLSDVDDKVASSEESGVADITTVAQEVFQPEQDAVEVSSAAVADEAQESTTAAAAAEQATVKVITTVTHKEIVRPVGSDDSQSDGTVVDASKTTSVETLPLSEVDKASSSNTEESSVAETTTLSEEVVQTVQDAAEVTSAAVVDESPESTTAAAAAEPATVKVITTVTQKEIIRPVDSDDSQSDVTVVDSSKTTSVETLPASEYQNADESSAAKPEVASSSENSVPANDETAASDAVSSGPSIVITDFVQKTASSSKEPTMVPTTDEETTDSP
uniref:7DB family member n=1 Tax=Rhipicephalus zambeziensis TaxID=60191 RepID=A0A224Y122_9ACAR